MYAYKWYCGWKCNRDDNCYANLDRFSSVMACMRLTRVYLAFVCPLKAAIPRSGFNSFVRRWWWMMVRTKFGQIQRADTAFNVIEMQLANGNSHRIFSRNYNERFNGRKCVLLWNIIKNLPKIYRILMFDILE